MKRFPLILTLIPLSFGLVFEAQGYIPVTREEMFPSDIIADYGPGYFSQTQNTIHQIAVCDSIFSGTVIATNDGYSAELSVSETIWGHIPSSNIIVRCVDMTTATRLLPNVQYLVLAYTNNWWADTHRDFSDNTLWHLYNYIAVTSRPPNHAVFSDFRILNPAYSAISFDEINFGGTNYWLETKSFVTNFISITKVQQNEKQAHDRIDSILFGTEKPYTLPPVLSKFLMSYKIMRYGEHSANTNFFLETP